MAYCPFLCNSHLIPYLLPLFMYFRTNVLLFVGQPSCWGGGHWCQWRGWCCCSKGRLAQGLCRLLQKNFAYWKRGGLKIQRLIERTVISSKIYFQKKNRRRWTFKINTDEATESVAREVESALTKTRTKGFLYFLMMGLFFKASGTSLHRNTTDLSVFKIQTSRYIQKEINKARREWKKRKRLKREASKTRSKCIPERYAKYTAV